MTTEFIAVPETARVDDAIDALKTFEGSREAAGDDLPDRRRAKADRRGSSREDCDLLASDTRLSELSDPHVACAPDTPSDEVAALFDKYNLHHARRSSTSTAASPASSPPTM